MIVSSYRANYVEMVAYALTTAKKINNIGEPSSNLEVISSTNSNKWLVAM